MNEIYKQWRVIRKQQGYSLSSLAEITQIPQQRLSEIENGERIPTAECIEKIEKTFGLKIFSHSKEDLEILELFDEFYDMLFYGSLNTKPIKDKANDFYKNKINSKYFYLLYLIRFVFDVLDNLEVNIDHKILKHIDFDEKAYHLYMIYKAVYLYEDGDLNESKRLLYQVVNTSSDEKMQSLAIYQLMFPLFDEYHTSEALALLTKAKQIFNKHGAFIREFKCNVFYAQIFANQHRHTQAITQFELCIKSGISLNLPQTEITYIYRNIAVYSIFNGEYEKAEKALNHAYKLESKNEKAILYYLYLYYFTKNLKQFKYWIGEGAKYIHSKAHQIEFAFWQALGKSDFQTTEKVIKKAKDVYDYYAKCKDYEYIYFYSEILISLFEQINDEINANLYTKEAKNLLKFTYNS